METPRNYFSKYVFYSFHWPSDFVNSIIINLQDDHKAFRRQLEDKRPIVESNLLSGKQYVASEPPISDTSDTEGNCHRRN